MKESLKNMTFDEALNIAREVIKGKDIIGSLETKTIIRVLELLVEKLDKDATQIFIDWIKDSGDLFYKDKD